MRLLLDTGIVIALSRDEAERLPRSIMSVLNSDDEFVASTASIWEIAIKTRLGKLDLRRPLDRLVGFLDAEEIAILAIDLPHVLAELDPDPGTRDPFDRLLVAQCAVEGMRLVTVDRALTTHPLAWRP